MESWPIWWGSTTPAETSAIRYARDCEHQEMSSGGPVNANALWSLKWLLAGMRPNDLRVSEEWRAQRRPENVWKGLEH